MKMAVVMLMVALVAACSSSTPVPDEVPDGISEDESGAVSQQMTADVDPVVQPLDEATHRISPDERTTVAWLAEGANAYVGKISLAPETEVPVHTHDSEEYLFILEGGGVMTIDGEEYELGPDTAVAVPSGVEHGFVNGPDTTVAVQVFADSEGAQRFLEWSETETVAPDGEAEAAEREVQLVDPE